jgi:hypothetical protein
VPVVRCADCGAEEERFTLHPPWVGPSWLGKPNPDHEKALTRRPCDKCGGTVTVVRSLP